MPRVLIAGCGYVGAATAELFQTNGWEVEGWTASEESARQLCAKPLRVRVVDITDATAVRAAAADFDAVIQSVSSRGGGADAYRRIYLQGARNLAASFPGAVHLFTSSTSVYAQSDGEWVTEASPAEPQRDAGRVLRETEELVLAADGIVVRLAGIYGPGRSALLRKFLDGTAAIDRRVDRYINQAHRDDIASALHLLVAKRVAEGKSSPPDEPQLFNVADHHPWTERACYDWLAQHFGRAVPPTATAPPARKRGNTNKRVSSAKLQTLGWSPQFPDFAAGMSRSVLPALEDLGA